MRGALIGTAVLHHDGEALLYLDHTRVPLIVVDNRRERARLGRTLALTASKRALVLGHDLHLTADEHLAQRLLRLARVRLRVPSHTRASQRREREASLLPGRIGHKERIAANDLADLPLELGHVAAVVGRHVVLPKAQALLFGVLLRLPKHRRDVILPHAQPLVLRVALGRP